MSNLPPPLPLFAAPDNDNSFAKRASLACLLSPALVIILGRAFSHAGSALNGHNPGVSTLIVGGVSCLIAVIGLILGMLSVALMKPGGRLGIVFCSLAGMVLIGLLAAVAIPNFARARTIAVSQRNAAKEIRQAVKDARDQQVAALTNGGSNAANLRQFQKSLDTAAQNASPEDAVLIKGTQAYLQRMQVIQSDYQRAYAGLVLARVLATSNLVDRSEIAERKLVVNKFLQCNGALEAFVKDGRDNYRTELVGARASRPGIESALAGYEKTAAPQRPLVAEVRSQDDRMGQAMLGVLGLLDANWGHWHYTTSSPRLVFDDQAALTQYNLYLGEIREAALNQAASQRQLAAVIQKLPTP